MSVVFKKASKQETKPRSVALSPDNGFMTNNSVNLNNYVKVAKKSEVPFLLLRKLARYDPLIRICINTIKRAVVQSHWEIRCKKETPKDRKEYLEEYRKKVYKFFTGINNNKENFRTLLSRVCEDLLVLDAGAIEKLFTLKNKELSGIVSVDGATIKPVYNHYGELGSPAYVQVLHNIDTGEKDKNNGIVASFEKDELVYIMANPQNDVERFGMGMSAIESVYLQVQAALEADMYNIKTFSRDNVPPGILDLGDISQEQAEEFIAVWNATVIGNTQGMKFVWGNDNAKKFTPFNNSQKDMQYAEYIEWLSRVKLAAFGLTSLDANITQDANRGNSKQQRNMTKTGGIRFYKTIIQDYITEEILKDILRNDEIKNNDYEISKELEFVFTDEEDLEDLKLQAEIDTLYVTNGVITRQEVREKQGKGGLDFEVVSEEQEYFNPKAPRQDDNTPTIADSSSENNRQNED